MPVSVRLKPDLERLLEKACKQTRKKRSAIIHEALAEYLKPRHPRLGDLIRQALAESPDGFSIARKQPRTVDKRNWKR